nr:peptide,salivary low MW [Homo sapiens]
GPPPPPPGKPQ